MNTEYQIISDKVSCNQQSQFYKFNNAVLWRDFDYVVGKNLLYKKVTLKKAMKKTFWKYSIAHLWNKNKTLRNLSFPLKSDSHFPKKLCYLLHWKPFKKDEKCFLFHLKSSFRSQDFMTFEFDQVVEYNKRNIFFRKSCRNWIRETSSRPLFVFQEGFNGLVVKAMDSQSRGPEFKTTGWLQGRLSLSSRGR